MRLKPLQSVNTLFVCASMTHPDKIRTCEQLEYAHRLQGYSKIAVHYVIEGDGNLAQGRPLNQPGVLAEKLNGCSWQVCLLGGVDDTLSPADTFTDSQYETLRTLIKELDKPAKYTRDFPGVRL